MTSSAKKKRERKKDFQKPKLKVGKAKPKPANQTETSFRAKSIVLNQQLNVDAPTANAQFQHHVSLLSSRSEVQRRDSLAFLKTCCEARKEVASLPLPSGALLDRLCPLILDGSGAVRTQLLKLLQSLPANEMQSHILKLLPHVRAGMTHLSKDVRLSSLDILSWLIATAGNDLVSCAGGWYQTLECFMAMLFWRTSETGKWTATKSSLPDSKATSRIITVLAEFLEVGVLGTRTADSNLTMAQSFPYWQIEYHCIPSKSNAYAYLNLFGAVQNDTTKALEDRDDRLAIYNDKFRPSVIAGIAECRKEGGEIGRATGLLAKVVERVPKQSQDG